jgi:predicted metalloprotease
MARHETLEGNPMKRRFLMMSIVVALVAVACGDDSSGPLFTSSTTTTTNGASGVRYPEAIVTEYIDGCSPEAGVEACRCTIEEFQRRLSLEEFLALSGTDLNSNPLVQEVVNFCLTSTDSTTSTTVIAATTTTVPGDEFVTITDIDTIIDLTIEDLETWWATELPASFGVAYERVSSYSGYIVSAGDTPFCGGPLKRDEFEQNAFYCGVDDTVQWDVEGLMIPLFQEFGDFTVALVLAHEWGHAVQNRFGFDDFSNPTIVSELQADCLAGAWTGRIANDESGILRLEAGDLEEAMAGFLLIGDSLGSAPDGSNSHGGSFDRLNAFFEGFNEGVPQCATYEDVRPVVVFIPLEPEDDPTEGGDLPYADTAPLLIGALEVFWSEAYPILVGDPWVPVSGAVPYLPSTGTIPSCGGNTMESTFYAGNAFYCPADDYVAWDDEVLFPNLYTEIGDFAIGLVLANEWARAAQTRAGVPINTPEAQLQVDCLAGVWTSAMLPRDNSTGIVLSAGDLEEGIAGFLTLSSVPSDDGSTIGAFQRFEAFKDGFFDGSDACGFPS